MPLLDHFHPPVSERRSWEGFHSLWAAALVERLNEEVLGEDYFADLQVHLGSQVEVDVATLAESQTSLSVSEPDRAGAATIAPPWVPPATSLVIPTVFPDDIEVQVFHTLTGSTRVAAIELVSPANKDRREERQAFAAKCVSYLTRGIGLIVVDIVTNRLANLHNDVVSLFGHGEPFLLPADGTPYVAAYRPSRQPQGDQIELWPVTVQIGDVLPTMPLALRNAAVVPVDLEGTYTEARRRSRLARVHQPSGVDR